MCKPSDFSEPLEISYHGMDNSLRPSNHTIRSYYTLLKHQTTSMNKARGKNITMQCYVLIFTLHILNPVRSRKYLKLTLFCIIILKKILNLCCHFKTKTSNNTSMNNAKGKKYNYAVLCTLYLPYIY